MQFKNLKVGYSIPCSDKSGPVGPGSEAPVLLCDILEQLEVGPLSDTSGASASLMEQPADGVTELSEIKHSRDSEMCWPQHV